MNWVTIEICTDCMTLIFCAGRKSPEQCDCEESVWWVE